MAQIIKVVGVGPGGVAFLTAAGAEAIVQAQVLVGAKRLLQEHAQPQQEVYVLGADLEAAIDFIRSCSASKRVAVLVSGDTGLYSFAANIASKFPAEQLEFIPGISSVQLMFARLQKPWQDAVVLSRHGRDDKRLVTVVQSGIIAAVLTDANHTPQSLAEELLSAGCQDLPVSVGCRLSYPDEFIFRGTLSSLHECNRKFINCVVVFGV